MRLSGIVGSSPTMTGGRLAYCVESDNDRWRRDAAMARLTVIAELVFYVIPCFAHRVIPALDAGISPYNRLSGQARQ